MNVTLTKNSCLILMIALFLTTACDENEGHQRNQDQRDVLAANRQCKHLARIGPGIGR